MGAHTLLWIWLFLLIVASAVSVTQIDKARPPVTRNGAAATIFINMSLAVFVVMELAR